LKKRKIALFFSFFIIHIVYNMRFTSISLFLIILFVLLISVVFSKFLPLDREGFITFSSTKPSLDIAYIPQYSKRTNDIEKIYDNIYFDTKNGNILELVAYSQIGYFTTLADAQTRVNTDPSNIRQFYVIKRDGSSSVSPHQTYYNVNGTVQETNVTESLIDNTESSYGRWIYNTRAIDLSHNTYQILYISWEKNTYIHIIQTSLPGDQTGNAATVPKHLNSYIFGPSTAYSSESISVTDNNLSSSKLNTTSPLDDGHNDNGNIVKFTPYDATRDVYRLNKFLLFDLTNGNLIRTDVSGTILDSVLSRDTGRVTSTKGTSFSNTKFNSWATTDKGYNHVIYMSNGRKAIVAILKRDITDRVKIGDVFRFTDAGIDKGTVSSSSSSSASSSSASSSSASSSSSGNTDASSNSFYSEYAKWLSYWNTIGGSTCNNYSEDYILKTQVVPPVCPSCPSCSAGGVCTSCGGQGGSGTQGTQGASAQQLTAAANGKFSTTADTSTPGGALATSTLGAVSGVENVAGTAAGTVENVAGTAGNLAGNAVNTTGGLLYAAGSGTSNLLQSAGSGASNLLQSAGSGATGLLRSAGSGVSNILTTDRQPSGTGYTATGSGSGVGYGGTSSGASGTNNRPGNPANQFNYNGALIDKGGNFMPVTADFSAFGR